MMENEKYTNNTLSISPSQESRQPQITNFNFSLVTIDKYIITFQVPVYNWWIVTVEVV